MRWFLAFRRTVSGRLPVADHLTLDNTNTYTRTIDAPDSATAQESVKALAKAEGLRVRTVRSARQVGCTCRGETTSYRVELAVERA